MELRRVVLARSIQVILSPSGTFGYLPDLVSQIKARYGFLTAPKDEDLVPSNPPKVRSFSMARFYEKPELSSSIALLSLTTG